MSSRASARLAGERARAPCGTIGPVQRVRGSEVDADPPLVTVVILAFGIGVPPASRTIPTTRIAQPPSSSLIRSGAGAASTRTHATACSGAVDPPVAVRFSEA